MKGLDKQGPIVYLAHGGGSAEKDIEEARQSLMGYDDQQQPSVLVSYAYIKGWDKLIAKVPLKPRSFVLDSGAFTAYNSGKVIDIEEYRDFCLERHRTDPLLDAVFSLDVIGDHVASMKNTEYLWAHGVECIPVYHTGEPWSVLEGYARNFPRIAVGGMGGLTPKAKRQFAEQVFARAWPARIHGLAVGGRDDVLAFPWFSADAASWALQPRGYGLWKMFGALPAREGDGTGRRLPMRSQVEWYLRLEREAQARWRKQMDELSLLPTARTG